MDDFIGKYFIAKNFIEKDELAEMIGVSIETINRHLKSGILPCHRFGTRVRFSASDVTTYFENCAFPATGMPTNRQKLEMAKAIECEKKAEKKCAS